MKNVTCKMCQTKIPVIDLRVAHDAASGFHCPDPNCPRASSIQQIEDLLDQVDAQRLRRKLQQQLDKGTSCPCCEQFAKRYKRKLNTGIARWLIALSLLEQLSLKWVHIAWIAAVVGGRSPDEARQLPIGASPIGSGDYAKARYWGLIEAKPNEDPAKHDSGFWRLTEKGRAFVRKQIKVPTYVLIYNSDALGFDGDDIDIDFALGKKFDYSELMRT